MKCKDLFNLNIFNPEFLFAIIYKSKARQQYKLAKFQFGVN